MDQSSGLLFPKPGKKPKKSKAPKRRERKPEHAGWTFDSRAERDLLDELRRNEDLVDIQGQKVVYLSEAHVGYRVDYRAWNKSRNRMEYFEAKNGLPSEIWNLKKKLWRYYGPGPLFVFHRVRETELKLMETVNVRHFPRDRSRSVMVISYEQEEPTMAAETRKIEVQVAKEFDDVMILFRDLVKVVRSNGDVTGLTGQLIAGIQGADQLDDEAKEIPFRLAASALNRGLEVAEALFQKAPAGEGDLV